MNILKSYLGGQAAAKAHSQPMEQRANPMAGMTAGGGDDVGRRMMADLQRDFGLTAEQAAGFVGNLAHESGDFKTLQEISPTVKGSRGGFGYAQWTGPRRVAFEEWAARNGMDPTSYEANYGFLKHELTATPEKAVLGALGQARTTEDAARVVSEKFLRPGIPAMGSRISRAQSYYNPMSSYARS